MFDRISSKVPEFVTACRLYIKMRIKEVPLEEQVQWVLSYMQEGSVNMWKENVLEELEIGELEFETVGEFLAEIKKEFREGEEESVKVAELRKLEQGDKTICAGVQESSKRKWIWEETTGREVQKRNEWSDQKEANGSREPTGLHWTVVQKGNGP